ncbi:dihydrofolate reductase [Kribbella steppae]|uniref:Dihydrofolate reductase n=1 Tax=Kribbella steppae TaxID=2512223 RepID=A0A4V2RY40_9ACTN|nr:dihydrofolate reductase family protein [Kribbella steppae]TCO17560.1 dihydrofolate reductase [Kribbella steppae]
MRNIVARLCMSEDGIVDRPEYWLPESGLTGVLDRLVTGAETVLLGRSTFEQYAASVARYHDAVVPLDRARKLVITSRPVIARPRTEVLQGDPHRVLRALKHVPGADIHVVGSVKLVRSLLRWRLIDEVSLLIHPVQAGFGTPLFGDRRALRLISMCAGGSGVLEASYLVDYAATATSSRSASAGRWGGTWSTASVATTASTAISTHA